MVALSGATVVMQILKRRLVRAEERQRAMAERDPLTDLLNRRSFDAALEHALELPEDVALILFDFDAFKSINDLHGHPAGDAVLVAVADACAGVIREGDSLARLGGDEFAVIAPGSGSAGVARIVAALEDAIGDADLPPQVNAVAASFAWAIAPQDAGSASELLDCADQRLLYRKRLNKTTF
jgi:diguanylate cyclase (GGDEF)-like protein